jgi:hypothetical protein
MDADVSTCIILVLKEVKFLAFLALQRNSFMFLFTKTARPPPAESIGCPPKKQEINAC